MKKKTITQRNVGDDENLFEVILSLIKDGCVVCITKDLTYKLCDCKRGLSFDKGQYIFYKDDIRVHYQMHEEWAHIQEIECGNEKYTIPTDPEHIFFLE